MTYVGLLGGSIYVNVFALLVEDTRIPTQVQCTLNDTLQHTHAGIVHPLMIPYSIPTQVQCTLNDTVPLHAYPQFPPLSPHPSFT
jgi:hypothetical protein